MPAISVLTPTCRPGGIDVNWYALNRQTFKDFEWVVCDTLFDKRKEILKDFTKDDRVTHVPQSKKDPKAKTWLNHAENEAIRASSGELIVLLQDYIYIDPDALEKFWVQYQSNKKMMISGVGHQYAFPGKEEVVNPEGLITVFEKPFKGKPEGISWVDPRVRSDQGSFYPCSPNDIEFNFCALPRQALYDVGGCDEEYDYIGHAWDNCSVAMRAFHIGYEPFIDQSNITRSIQHDDFFDAHVKEHDFKDIAVFHNKRMKDIFEGKHPLKYEYLS